MAEKVPNTPIEEEEEEEPTFVGVVVPEEDEEAFVGVAKDEEDEYHYKPVAALPPVETTIHPTFHGTVSDMRAQGGKFTDQDLHFKMVSTESSSKDPSKQTPIGNPANTVLHAGQIKKVTTHGIPKGWRVGLKIDGFKPKTASGYHYVSGPLPGVELVDEATGRLEPSTPEEPLDVVSKGELEADILKKGKKGSEVDIGSQIVDYLIDNQVPKPKVNGEIDINGEPYTKHDFVDMEKGYLSNAHIQMAIDHHDKRWKKSGVVDAGNYGISFDLIPPKKGAKLDDAVSHSQPMTIGADIDVVYASAAK